MKHEHFWTMCAAAGASAAVLAGAATAALAQQTPITTIVGEREPGNRIYVSYRDLNLVDARDVGILNRRVGRASQDVCDPVNFNIGQLAFDRCVNYAWSGARPQIALAVQRAREIAATGSSHIPAVAIAVTAR